MSKNIYDDLGDSGYLDNNKFLQQLQQFPTSHLDDSINNSRQFIDFNQELLNADRQRNNMNYCDDKSAAATKQAQNLNQNNFMTRERDDFLNQYSKYEQQEKTPEHFSYQQTYQNKRQQQNQDLISNDDNISSMNQMLQMTSNAKQEGNNVAANIMHKQQQLQQQQVKRNQIEEKDQVQFEDDDFQDHQMSQKQQQQFRQPNYNFELQNLDINQFKNQNDQVALIMQQLKVPQYNQDILQPKNLVFNNVNQSMISSQSQQHNFYYDQKQQQQEEEEQQIYKKPIQNNNQNMNLLKINNGPSQKQLNQDNSLLAMAKRAIDPSNISSLNSGCGGEQEINSSNENNEINMYKNSGNSNFYSNSQMSNMSKMNNPPAPTTAYFQQMNYQNNSGISQPLQHQQQALPSQTNDQFYNNNNRRQMQEKENQDHNIIHNRGHSERMTDNDEKKMNAFKTQPTHFYNRQLSVQDQKRKEIMEQFDNIPIKDLNKINKDENLDQQQYLSSYDKHNDDNQMNEIQDNGAIMIDESQKTLEEQIESQQWKIRMNAYKEISDLFLQESKNVNNKTNNKRMDNDEDNENEASSFDVYGPKLQIIISDTNLIAQYEGLACLFAYMRFAPDIKDITFQVHAILLDKVQITKPNFREMTMKILQTIIKRDRSQVLIPALLKRFKSKNQKVMIFAMQVITESFNNQIAYDVSQMKQILSSMQDNFSHSNKEIRDTAIGLLKLIYSLCEDEPQSIIKNIKQNLRPVQIKELKEILQQVDKSTTQDLVTLFSSQSQQQQLQNQPSDNIPSFNKQNKNKIERDDFYDDDIDQDNENDKGTDIDLAFLVPSNFNEIPYLPQINIKKKSMEQFNQELEKIIQRKQQNNVIVNKDYSPIFNVVIHLLEDSNVLVFSEAIKCVELMTIILNKNIKQAKLKQFIQLLTEKYKETKSVVVTQINKAMSIIIDQQCLPLNSMLEYLVGTLVQNNKNPRVKQLILEKVDQVLQQSDNQLNEDELSGLFKAIKDKLKVLVLQDTNANVRDASVGVLVQFRRILVTNQMVTDTINSLNKQRITEINKRAKECPKSNISQQQLQQQPEKNHPQQTQQKSNSVPKLDNLNKQLDKGDFSYQGRVISGQYQVYLADIVLTIKKISQGQNINPDNLKLKWEDNIEKLGEMGIQETKPVIVSCIHWYLTTFYNTINENYPFQYLEHMTYLIKTIYCIIRNVEIMEDSNRSQELEQALIISNILFSLTSNKRQSEAIYNVMLSATTSGITSIFMTSIKQVLSSLQQEKFYKEFENKKIEVLEFVFNWLGTKLDLFLQRGVTMSEIEDLRTIGLSYINENMNDEDKTILIQTILKFKQRMLECKSSNKQQENPNLDQQQYKQDDQKDERVVEEEEQEIQLKSQTQEFLETIDNDYDKGIQMIKSLSLTQEMQDFKNKESISQKLVTIIETHYKNPQQLSQQAYSLKALLWFKQELLGLEDCFKLSYQIMESYIRTELDSRDSSVELYLLNNWTKELSLRDIIDRISFVSKNFQEKGFIVLFKWIMQERLQAANENDKWSLEDFRKVCIYLARCIKNVEVKDFIQECVDQFGVKRVREFMEIQLMHAQQEYNTFIEWFNIKYRNNVQQLQDNNNNTGEQVRFPQIKIDQVQEQNPKKQMNKRFLKNNEDLELANALQTSNTNNEEGDMPLSARGNTSIHSQLYQQLRQKRKTSNQRKQGDNTYSSEVQTSSNNKYEDIINKLESKLQIKGGLKNNQQQDSLESYDKDEYITNGSSQISKYNEQLNKLGGVKESNKTEMRYEEYMSNMVNQNKQQQQNIHQTNKYDQQQQQKQQQEKENDGEEEEQELENDKSLDNSRIFIDQNELQNNKIFQNIETQQQQQQNQYIINKQQQQLQKTLEEEEEEDLYEQINAENKLKQSMIKENRCKEDLRQLEDERKQIELQRELLMREKNHETQEWKNKFNMMRDQHEDVIENLAEANKCYLVQVNENEDLRNQLKVMQEQHIFMMQRFEEIESKIQQQQNVKKSSNQPLVKDSLETLSVVQKSPEFKNNKRPQTQQSKIEVVKEESMSKIQEVFSKSNSQISRQYNDSELCIKRVQELLLNTDNKLESKEFGQSMFFYYQQMKNSKDRLEMIKSVNLSLENQDVLFALQVDIYIVLLKFLLRAFALEKAKLERTSVQISTSTLNRGGGQFGNEQNEVTVEIQKIVSKLLNSKEFTTSLVTLFQILKDSLPQNMSIELSDEDKQFLRVLMRCVSRISKALHSESPDLIRGFDVLIEMQKIFLTHPPECLREDMPSLQEFDFVYRTLKDVSDKLMELQPDKVRVFLSFVKDHKPNAFIMYMRQVTGFKEGGDQQSYNNNDEDDDQQDQYDGQYNQIDDEYNYE